MNRSASKLLHKYASFSETDIRALKKWWNALSWEEKTAERKRMEEEMGIGEGSEEEVEKSE